MYGHDERGDSAMLSDPRPGSIAEFATPVVCLSVER